MRPQEGSPGLLGRENGEHLLFVKSQGCKVDEDGVQHWIKWSVHQH